MEENKITRRRPNLFDGLFILLLAAVAVVAFLLSHGGFGGNDTVRRTYRVELRELDAEMVDYVAVGDQVTDNIKNYAMGTVTAIEVVPATKAVLDEEAGIVRQAPIEGKIMLHLTVEVDTVEDADSVDAVSGYTLRTGASVSCSAGQLSGSGYILSLER